MSISPCFPLSSWGRRRTSTKSHTKQVWESVSKTMERGLNRCHDTEKPPSLCCLPCWVNSTAARSHAQLGCLQVLYPQLALLILSSQILARPSLQMLGVTLQSPLSPGTTCQHILPSWTFRIYLDIGQSRTMDWSS